MKPILYINGSPRGEKRSSSAEILKDLASFLKEEELRDEEFTLLSLSCQMGGNIRKELQTMDEAEIWILSLPLYVDTLPGHLTWWLKQYEIYRNSCPEKSSIRVYGIVNCGFPEAVQNREALKILKIFCRKNGMDWRFGIGLGKGEPYKQMKNIPLRSFMKSHILEAFRALGNDLVNEDSCLEENHYVSVRFPPFLYRLVGSRGWKSRAKGNGLSTEDLFAKPLAE